MYIHPKLMFPWEFSKFPRKKQFPRDCKKFLWENIPLFWKGNTFHRKYEKKKKKKKKQLITKISDRSSFQWFFFTFIHFPALLLVKTIDSYLHEFCARGILLAISVTWRNVKEHAIELRVTSL